MITRTKLDWKKVIRFSWKNLSYSFFISLTAYILHVVLEVGHISIPPSVVAILGGALAILLGFKNASSYDRWWEARKIWGGIVNESRTFTRQALTVVDPDHIPEDLMKASYALVHGQIAWVYALRLRLLGIKDRKIWDEQVGVYFEPEDYEFFMSCSNQVTQIGMHQGRAIKELNAREILDIYSYIQIDDTLTRLTDLQGKSERIKGTPLPRPYEYYTRFFLVLFILFFPFGMVDTFMELAWPLLIIPVTMITGWIFYQIYVFGKVHSDPFEGRETDISLLAIARTIEIDLKEIIGEKDIPPPLKEENGVLL